MVKAASSGELWRILPMGERALLIEAPGLSEVLDLPVGTLKSRLHRIRSALRRKLESSVEPSEADQRLVK